MPRAGGTRSAKARSEMPTAHMPRKAPPCMIGSAVGTTAAGVMRLASWAPTANFPVSRTSRKISRSAKLMPMMLGTLEQRAVPAASVTMADEYSLGKRCSTCAK